MAPWSLRIKSVLYASIVFVTMVLPLAGVQTTRGQGADINIDSLLAARDTVTGIQLEPVYTGTVGGNVSSVEMSNALAMTGVLGWGSRLSANIRQRQRRFRLQPRSEDRKSLDFTLSHSFRPGLSTSLMFNETRQFNRVAALRGELQDFILNDRAIKASATYAPMGREQPLKWNIGVDVGIKDGEKTFKNDATQSASLGTGVRYDTRVVGMPLALSARGGVRQQWESSTTASGIDVFDLEGFQDADSDNLGSRADSLAFGMVLAINDSTSLRVDYSDLVAVRRYADQARGAQGVQKTGEENLIWEKLTQETRSVRFGFNARPVRGFNLRIDSQHSEQNSDYATQTTRLSMMTTDDISATGDYVTRWGMGVTATLERREQSRDLGSQSIGSFDQVRKRFNLAANQRFSKTLSVNGSYDTQLTQAFYIDPSNPRDRDQLDNAINGTIRASIWSDLRVQMQLSWSRTQFVNIDKSQSSNNRAKERYDFRPSLEYRINNRMSVGQTYGLAWEFTEFDFRPDDDSLDRNISFSNTFNLRITERVTGRFNYRLNLHDRGSFLPLPEDPGGERFYSPDTEDRRDRIALGIVYTINPHLTLVTDYDYSQRTDQATGSPDKRITEDGGIQGGLRGNYTWGENRALRFELMKGKRFGEFNTEIQNDFWVMNSELKYAF